MANTYVKSIGIARTGRTWVVVVNGKVVERLGNEEAARAAALWWQVNYREEPAIEPMLPQQVAALHIIRGGK